MDEDEWEFQLKEQQQQPTDILKSQDVVDRLKVIQERYKSIKKFSTLNGTKLKEIQASMYNLMLRYMTNISDLKDLRFQIENNSCEKKIYDMLCDLFENNYEIIQKVIPLLKNYMQNEA